MRFVLLSPARTGYSRWAFDAIIAPIVRVSQRLWRVFADGSSATGQVLSAAVRQFVDTSPNQRSTGLGKQAAQEEITACQGE